jgi:hypothetical protein
VDIAQDVWRKERSGQSTSQNIENMDRNDKTKRLKDGATALNRIQVQQCGISKENPSD